MHVTWVCYPRNVGVSVTWTTPFKMAISVGTGKLKATQTRKKVKWYNELLYLFIIIFHYRLCWFNTDASNPRFEELGLEFSHKECIINGGWLIINAGQKLLEKSYPAMGGLQSIVLGETLSFDICHGIFVQILNVGRNHWIAVLRNCESMIFVRSIMKCLHTGRWSRKKSGYIIW